MTAAGGSPRPTPGSVLALLDFSSGRTLAHESYSMSVDAFDSNAPRSSPRAILLLVFFRQIRAASTRILPRRKVTEGGCGFRFRFL